MNSNSTATPFDNFLGRTRYIVIIAVLAVLLVAFGLFLLGAMQALTGLWGGVQDIFKGAANAESKVATKLTLEFLEIVATMMKAVVFYLVGVGLYSLFISPLNIAVSLGVESLSDLEDKIVSVVIVILSLTFLERFIRWEKPLETLQFGASLALVIVALTWFQKVSHGAKALTKKQNPDVQARAKREMFENDDERHETTEKEVEGTMKKGD